MMRLDTSLRRILIALACCAPLLGCPISGGPSLNVAPFVIDFGSVAVEKSVAITNSGSGLLQWSVEEDISWLSIDGASGVTSSLGTSRLTLTVDRSALPATGTFNGTFRITSNGGTQTVSVSVRIAGPASVAVAPTTLNLLNAASPNRITVTNGGESSAAWSLSTRDPDDPSLLVDVGSAVTISPTYATLGAGQQSTITVDVDRDDEEFFTGAFVIRVAYEGVYTDVRVNITQGLSPAIGVDPGALDFGTNAEPLTLNVYNSGDANSTLDFVVTTDRPDLIFFSPASGGSVGSADLSSWVDNVPITVLVDRSALQSSTDGGTIYIQDSAGALEAVEVLVSVEAAPLSFEGAVNRSRPPFIMRFVFLMRDGTGTALDTLEPSVLDELQTAFSVDEDQIPLDMDETNLFVTGSDNLKMDIALLLDYTGSMYAALQELYPSSEDALQDLYAGERDDLDDGIVPAFLDSIPASPSYSVALMEYHERQQQNRFISGYSSTAASREVAKQNMDLFYVPAAEHGASEIYDSIIDACEQMAARDEAALPLDDADVRALIFISDGRDTSSIEDLSTAIRKAEDLRVRLYPIGFGENVNTTELLQMAQETGGHYYAAPDVATLNRLLVSDTTSGLSGSEGLIVKELKRQIVLTYNTLFQEGSHTYLIHGDYQGLQGSFQRDAVFAIGGDVRAGQISLRTNGIQADGTAVITVRADYVPRNITQFRFRFREEDGRTVSIQRAENGLISGIDWFDVPDAESGAPLIAGSEVKFYLTNEANPLQYAAFGNLLTITVSGYPAPGGPEEAANQTFDFQFWVDNRVYVDPPYTKFFQYPNVLGVGYQPTRASEIPISVEEGFNPDAAGAWDNDLDGTDDFEDLTP